MYDGYAALAPRRPLPQPSADGNVAGVLAIIDRLETAIDEETVAIRTDMGFDIAASNARKSRHLYDLSRAMKTQDASALPRSAEEALSRLRGKLAVNQAAIEAHLSAVKEVAGLMQDAIQHAEADGTYSASAFQRF